jgi:hypothetical protein
MTRPLHCWILGLGFVLASAPLLAQTVYQWKDARGVTHYSDSPPPKGATKRELRSRQPASAEASAVTTAKVPEGDSAQCAQARLNLTRLQSDAEVGLDQDRDGKIDAPMSAEARARQIERVNAAIKAYCPEGR